MTNNPLVSICIPTYNRADMVGKAIESALNQTYKDIEVIVVDNASTDNTEEIVASYDDPRLKYFKNDENLGIFGNFNRCIDLYNGEFLHILHSDDYIEPHFTEACVRFFEKYPNVSLTSTSSRSFGSDIKEDFTYSNKDVIFHAPEGFRHILSKGSYIICPSVMVRRGLYEDKKCGKFRIDFCFAADYYQWLKVTRYYDVGYISDTWINYRRGKHADSYNLLFKNTTGYLEQLEILTVLQEDLGNEIGKYSSEINSAIQRCIRGFLNGGFTRAEKMDAVEPSYFAVISFKVWLLLLNKSWKALIVNISYLLLIVCSFILLHFSILRQLTIMFYRKIQTF